LLHLITFKNIKNLKENNIQHNIQHNIEIEYNKLMQTLKTYYKEITWLILKK